MQSEMSQFVRHVEAATLGALHRVDEDERHVVAPQREGVYLDTLLDEREDANAVQFKQVHHVPYRALAESPVRPDGLRSDLRSHGFAVGWDVRCLQLEPPADPLRELDREAPGGE